MHRKLTHRQYHALQLSRQGRLSRSERGYRAGRGESVSYATTNSLIARGLLKPIGRQSGSHAPLLAPTEPLAGTQLSFDF